MKKANNKIGIPWYRRNVSFNGGDDMGNTISFNLPTNNRPKIEIRTRQPVREPVPQPATQPALQPVPDWVLDTAKRLRELYEQERLKNPLGYPIPNPIPTPVPIPSPERNPNNPNNPSPEKPLFPQPQFPAIPTIPAWTTEPNYDWGKHLEEVMKNLPDTVSTPEPVIEKNPIQQTLENILKPAIWFFVGNEIRNKWVEVNITDPIYNDMLNDPVLGSVLREAEKANLDAKTVGTILANFDWENGDYKDLEKSLIIGIGAVGAARLLVFIVGRKVVFRL